jgi:nucleoside diphosphate kinase
MEKVPFYTPELNRSEPEPLPETLREVISLLKDAQLEEEIREGNVTLAMIRPQVGPNANLLGLDDQHAADQIEGMIENLGILAKFSFELSKAAAEEFYGGDPKVSMLKESPTDPSRYDSRWPEFIDFMTSGPVTVLLLHSPAGDAIPLWRSHLGHWNIDEIRDPSTIRGKLGVNKYNNLVHGSDAPEAVIRELGIITNCLEDIQESL